MRMGNKEVPVAGLANMVIIVGGLFGSWFFADNYFAHASDYTLMAQNHQASKWTFEQSQNDMRIDIIEDRVWREQKQPSPDSEQIGKWRGQVDKLEMRQQHLQNVQDQLHLKKVAP